MLDVRQHIDFIARERDTAGVEVEVYRSGAGKSGGQRQKLAATCLAAALRYQLGGIDGAYPTYSTVVLDEAFDKADPKFTALAMNIFVTFGFPDDRRDADALGNGAGAVHRQRDLRVDQRTASTRRRARSNTTKAQSRLRLSGGERQEKSADAVA